MRPEPSNLVLARRMWLMPGAFILVFVFLTLALWRLQRLNELDDARSDAEVYRSEIVRRLQTLLKDSLEPLPSRWQMGVLDSRDNFISVSNQVASDAGPALGFIDSVDSNDICTQVGGSGASDVRVGQNLSEIPIWRDLIAAARKNGTGAASKIQLDANGDPFVYGALPGVGGTLNGVTPGAIIFQFHLKPLLEKLVVPEQEKRIVLELQDDGQVFFSSPLRGKNSGGSETMAGEPVSFLDRTWKFRAGPSAALIAQHLLIVPAWAIWVWLGGAILLVGSAYQVVLYRKANDRRVGEYVKALETIAETSAALLGKIGHGREFWQSLPDAARSLTSARVASVGVLDDNNESIRSVANSGEGAGRFEVKTKLKHAPMMQQCVDTRQTVVVEDVENDPRPMNQALLKQHHVRSFLHIPLLIDEKVIGLLTMASDKPGCFNPTAVRLAELWGKLAGVTIANERIFEQMGQAIETRDRLLRQRDAIFNLNSTITRLRSTGDILRAIVEQAPVPLGVDLCQVVLLDEKNDELVVAATTPPYDRGLHDFRFRRKGTNSNESLNQRKMIVVEDGPANPKSQPYLKTVLPCGSIMHVPLFTTGGKPIGVLVLLREKTGSFNDEQQNLAQLFGGRAAVAIENAQLYQQTLQGSQTQAMLLRELSHRVKNSLSGIVALLSIERPAMSAQAKQWLSRVVDRIRTLARTHEMFTEGKPGGSLRELFDQTIKSLSVVTQAGVSVRTELVGGDRNLRPDRAVSVAMLLHELCYNALVHGLGGAGKLLVRSTLQPDQMLLIEVIDNGRGFVEGEPDDLMLWEDSQPRTAVLGSTHTGLGLNLVRDFVARELHGQFSIESTPDRGTTARVLFKLLDEEIGNA